jgi:type III restriction enzyme
VSHLHALIADRVSSWAKEGYPCDDFPAFAELIEHQTTQCKPGGPIESRYLRSAQIEALTTYWYLRLVENTPSILDLYKSAYPSNSELRKALGLTSNAIRDIIDDIGLTGLLDHVRTDNEFVATHKLESLRETVALDYPSYILALTMGAGKTTLIGSIIATEFAMALEYPEGPFVQNALVFAPGRTIMRSLRQIAAMPFDRILPPRHFKTFAATVKLIFTRDGDPDIPVIRGDSFNIIVTNTEKIRITKETVRKGDLKGIFSEANADEARGDLANRRLQAIASLPHLAVFSDEAHHTYGAGMEKSLKRVRETINYLHRQTNLITVVNTTGTPYLKRQPLLDVVFWYGLSAGIKDGILKSVAGNIHAYTFDSQSLDDFLAAVLDDFMGKYGDVSLPAGHPAKLALYFPQVVDLKEARPLIEAKLMALGYPADCVLAMTNESSAAEKAAFERLNDPDSRHRIILLVNIGTEGWDCPSLFATALARQLRTSNNFVLQAACRCLRQVPGNPHSASIYLTEDNRKTLDKELQETYNETLNDLNIAGSNSRVTTIRLRKVNIPPLVVMQTIRRVQRSASPPAPLTLTVPDITGDGSLIRQSFDLSPATARGGVLAASSPTEEIATNAETIDPYTAATKLAAVYRADFWAIKSQLCSLYPDGEIPENHLPSIASQVEAATSAYDIVEEQIEVALALVKPAGFTREIAEDGTETYTAEISYPVTKEHLLLSWEAFQQANPQDFGFHYTPYNFDSNPEAEFFTTLLHQLNVKPEEVEDLYFTGALTSSSKTDFAVEYKDSDGKWRCYTPDFILRRKDGRCLIIEIKSEQHEAGILEDMKRDDANQKPITHEGTKAVALKRWSSLNPDRLKYELVFAGTNLRPGATDSASGFANTPSAP